MEYINLPETAVKLTSWALPNAAYFRQASFLAVDHPSGKVLVLKSNFKDTANAGHMRFLTYQRYEEVPLHTPGFCAILRYNLFPEHIRRLLDRYV